MFQQYLTTIVANRPEAQNYVQQWFTIAVTGARSGEVLVGRRPATSKAQIMLQGQINPNPSVLALIYREPDLWQQLLNKLGEISYFKTFSLLQREQWLITAAEQELSSGRGGNVDFTHYPNIQIKFLSLGQHSKSNKFYSLSEYQQRQLVEAGYLPAITIRQLITTKGGKPSLVFKRSFWAVQTSTHSEQAYTGLIIDVDEGKIGTVSNYIPISSKIIYVHAAPSTLDVVGTKSGQSSIRSLGSVPHWQSASTNTVALQVSREQLMLDENNLQRCCQQLQLSYAAYLAVPKDWPPSGYRSLLQKLIRFRAEQVLIEGQLYPTVEIVQLTFLRLLFHPGALSPTIQKYVTGLQSATKRLFVTIAEDSYVAPSYDVALLSLMAASWLADVERWTPSLALIVGWTQMAALAYKNHNFYDYNARAGCSLTPFTLSANNSALANCSALLDMVKSFDMDLGMVRDIAYKQGHSFMQSWEQPKIMPLEHCCDQHWTPEMIYLFPPASIEVMLQNNTKTPFSEVFMNIFRKVTGKNARKSDMDAFDANALDDESVWIKTVRAVQAATLNLKFKTPIVLPLVPMGQVSLPIKLSPGWIAALLGHLALTVNQVNVWAILDPLQLNHWHIVRTPFRGMQLADTKLDPAVVSQAQSSATIRLQNSLPLNAASWPHPGLIQSSVQLVGNNLLVQQQPLTASLNYQLTCATFTPPVEVKRSNLLKLLSDPWPNAGIVGLEPDYLLTEFTTAEIRRTIQYLLNTGPQLELPSIDRHGGGVDITPLVTDLGAYQLILLLAYYWPLVLQRVPHEIRKFKVYLPTVCRDLALRWSSQLAALRTPVVVTYESLHDLKGRTLKDYQASALAQMQARHEQGRKGQLLWLNVGSGKTLLTLSYLAYLQRRQELLTYLIYTLPLSALQTVLDELVAFNLLVCIHLPVSTSTIKNKYQQILNNVDRRYVQLQSGFTPMSQANSKGVVNVILHDHLQYAQDQLIVTAPQSILIIDEVHKCMRQSLRTAIAINLAQLAPEFIGLSGTMVIDEQSETLARWLKQVVDYEVNDKNYVVASTEMITRHVDTGLKVTRIDRSIQWTEYPDWAQKRLSLQEFQAVVKSCYWACYAVLADLARILLSQGHGCMLVVDVAEDQLVMQQLLVAQGLNSTRIKILAGSESLNLHDRTHYDIVVVTKYQSLGYSLVGLDCMLSSVYFVNTAQQIQLEGRINRIDSPFKEIFYYYAHCGPLTTIYQRHLDAKSLDAALRSLGM